MSRVLTIEPEAEADLNDAYRWYEDQRPGLGRAFLDCVAKVLGAGRNPEVHAVTYRNVRQTLVKRFPYVVCYTSEADRVFVIAVMHAHRNPKEWQSRGRSS